MDDRNYRRSKTHSVIPRRSALRGTVVGSVGLAALAALGCGQESQQSTTTSTTGTGTATASATAQAKRGGILRRSGGEAGHYDTRGATLDPHQLSVIGARGYRLMYQGLLSYHPLTLDLQPELAQKWEQRSQTEFSFTLAQNVKWHNKPPANGRAMTAQDVVYSLERVRTKDPKFVHSSLLNLVDKVEAPDNNTVRITLKEPDAALLNRLSSDGMMMMAREVVEKADKFATADEVVGTGAFIMKSSQEKVNGEYIRNPDYWKPGLPYLDGILTPYFNTDQLAFAAFLGGQLDVSLVPGQEARKNAAEYTKTGADWFPQDFIQTIQQNVKVKPFDDERVWKAMKLLIDHDELKTGAAEVWYGRGRHGSVIPPSMAAWDYTEEEYSKMLEWRQPKDAAVKEALTMLSAAGYNASNPAKFEITSQNTANQQTYAELLQSGYKRLSQGVVNPGLKLVDFATSSTIRSQRSFDMYQGGHAASISEPDTWFTQLYITGASRNYAQFSDPTFDQMVAKQRTIFDVAQRKVAVKEILKYMIENTPFTSSANHFAFTATKATVKGWIPEHYTQGNTYETLWLDG